MPPAATLSELAQKSAAYRRHLLEAIYHAGTGHTGGSLSCVDILNVLYNRILRVSPATLADPGRDRYVQSKGHSVEALYVVLADQGFFPAADLDTMARYKSPYVGHPTRKIPGIEHNTGALGHGLPFAVGLALGAKLDSGAAVKGPELPPSPSAMSAASAFRVFALLGDGELAEGSNWEAAMAAAHYSLDNLTAIIDCNALQITGRTKDVMNHEPLRPKFEAFGWAVREVDGHDLAALISALEAPLAPGSAPSAVIARTIKGKGVSFMENSASWHHRVPTADEFARAMAELGGAQ